MSKLKVIKKVLLTLILISIVILLDKVFAKYVSAATSNNSNPIIYWNRETSGTGHNLLTSTDYYCIEFGKGIKQRYKYKKIGTIEWTSEEQGDQYYRAIAKILYDGKDNGYNNYSKYQLALWILINENKEKGWPYKVSNNKVNFIDVRSVVKDPKNKNTYKSLNSAERAVIGSSQKWNDKVSKANDYLNQVKNEVKEPTIYTGNKNSKEKGPDIISIDKSNSSITFNNNIGYFKLDSLHKDAYIEKVIVTYEDNKQTTITDSKNNWVKLYKNSNANSNPISDFKNEIKQNETIYIKNLRSGYNIKNVEIFAKLKASGYEVKIDTWAAYYNVTKRKNVEPKYIQRIISTEVYEGQDKQQSILFSVKEPPMGEIEVIKEGVYGEKDLVANFKLYCKGKGFVVGNANADKTYTDNSEMATIYKSSQKISKLLKDYNYELIEVSLEESGRNWKYYSNPVKMKNAKIQYKDTDPKNLTIEKNTIKFSLIDEETKIIIQNDETHKDLLIIKKDSNSSDRLNGAVMKLYVPGEGWLTGDEGNYSFVKTLNKSGATQVEGYTTKTTTIITAPDNDFPGAIKVEPGSIELKSLPKNIYYVYETTAPENYNLADQYKSNVNDPNNFNSPEMVLVDVIDLNTENNNHIATYYVDNTTTETQPLKIIKQRSDDGKPIEGVQMAIYYENGEEKGWLSGNKAEEYNYESDINNSVYTTNSEGIISLEGLKVGKYHVYERAVPQGYDIKDQAKYKSNEVDPNENNNVIKENNWVYLGFTIKESNGTIKYELENKKNDCHIENEPLINLDITKVDAKDSAIPVKGAQMKIYTKNKSDASDKGWLSINKNEIVYNNKNPEDATTFITDENGKITIEGLKYNRQYYVYEVKAPDDDQNNGVKYDLTQQPGYMDNDGQDTKNENYVTIIRDGKEVTLTISEAYGYAYLTPEVDETNQFKYKFTNEPTLEPKKGIIDILKQDTNGEDKLNGAEIRLYWVEEGKGKEEGYWLGTKIDESGTKRLVKTKQNPSMNPFVTGTDVYIENATEEDKAGRIYLKDMPLGTYYVVETKAPNGYILSSTDDELGDPDSNIVKNYVQNNHYLYLGKLTLNENSLKNGIAYTTDVYENEPTPPDDMPLEIIKYDPDASDDNIIIESNVPGTNRLNGAKIKLYARLGNEGSGWIKKIAEEGDKYKLTPNVEDATEFETGKDVDSIDGPTGTIYITGLKKGDYYIYETKAPTGYVLEKQDGYKMKKGQKLKKSGEEDQMYDNNTTYSSLFGFVFLGKANDQTIELEVENEKFVSLSGSVWVDKQDTKKSIFDYVYKKGTKDEVLKDRPVHLYAFNKDTQKFEKIADTTTNESGEYKFEECKYKDPETGEEKSRKLKYWDLENAYVEFEYDNKKYVVVDPFVGNDSKINSKAQEYSMSKEELEDEKLKGNGSAVAKGLLDYYNNQNNTIEGINLGLLEKREPTFRVSENLAYVKIKMNGFTYTYNYNPIEEAVVAETSPVTHIPNLPNTPTVQKTKRFSVRLYPSDIAQNIENSSEDLKVYVVYNVGVENLETTDYDDIYVERNLFLNSLTNKFNLNDNKMYELSPNDNTEDANSAQFKRWSLKNETEAVYNLSDDEGNAFKDGIEKGKSKNTYIQFKLTASRVTSILTGNVKNNEAATAVTANGYHEYQRTDNLWKHTEKEEDRKFEGAKGNNCLKENNNKNPYYTHKSIFKDSYDNDISVKFSLYNTPRQISGVVFEDVQDPNRTNENLGNGIKDQNENNKGNGIRVELLVKDENEPTGYKLAKLYKQKGNGYELTDAVVEKTNDGKYTFEGVVPGYYYIRFTYGKDNNNKFSDGTIIKSSDYKSTIIRTDESGNSVIKSAMEAKSNAEKEANARWYKALDNTNYSTAVDDLDTRKEKSYSFDQNIVNDEIFAKTPVIGITFENTQDDSYLVKDDESLPRKYSYLYEGFNLGLIKQVHEVLIEKSITHIDFTSQIGSKLVSDNPVTSDSKYIKNNPVTEKEISSDITKLAKYVSIETEPEFIYGSSIKTTYKVIVKNNSPKDYIEDEKIDESGVKKDNPYYGYYYKYGLHGTEYHSKDKTIKLEVMDFLDEKYKYDSKASIIVEQENRKDDIDEKKTFTTNNVKYKDDYNNKEYINIKNWNGENEGLASGEESSIEYSLSGLIGDLEKNTDYNNTAQIAKIEDVKLTTIESNFDWKASNATLVIFPDTGENRSYTYLIVGIVSFATLAIGFVLIKKKVLN